MTDERIIALLNSRDEQGLQACISAYGAYCQAVASQILPDSGDAEEAVADTWLALWDSIPPQHPQYLRLYIGRIARNQALRIWRRNHARCRGGGEIVLALEELGELAGGACVEETVNTKELARKISAFLKSEPEARRRVFVRRYFYMEPVSTIAVRWALTESNVRMMLSRTRQRLKKYLQKEGYDL